MVRIHTKNVTKKIKINKKIKNQIIQNEIQTSVSLNTKIAKCRSLEAITTEETTTKAT